MDKYNAQEPRTVNTINNGNMYTITTLLYRVYKKKRQPRNFLRNHFAILKHKIF
jgi:hypothetical protein